MSANDNTRESDLDIEPTPLKLGIAMSRADSGGLGNISVIIDRPQYPHIAYDQHGLPRVQYGAVPALSWQTSAMTEPSRRKDIQVPEAIADKYIKKAIEETLGTDLPKDTTFEGGLYKSGGKITANSKEFPENPDGRWTVDITPQPKKAKN
jgi:hypothetical protein